MATEYIIVAGPQAAGKSSLLMRLRDRFPQASILPESRQVVVRRYNLRGAIFMDTLDELEVIYADIHRLIPIVRGAALKECYIDETSVFTLGHARAHGIDLLDGYFNHYCEMLSRLRTGVLFLDVPPETSWARRRDRYQERIQSLPRDEQNLTMQEYEAYLHRLHPELVTIYNRIPFPKRCVDASGPAEATLAAALSAFASLQRELPPTAGRGRTGGRAKFNAAKRAKRPSPETRGDGARTAARSEAPSCSTPT